MSHEWTIVIPVPKGGWLTANPRSTRNTYGRGDLVKAWRQAAYDAAAEAKLPTGLDYVEFLGEARSRGRNPVHDKNNLRPTLKAAIDGLAAPMKGSPGYLLIPGDSDKHVRDEFILLGPRLPWRPPGHPIGELHLHIREIIR
jgi:hypothetical protein